MREPHLVAVLQIRPAPQTAHTVATTAVSELAEPMHNLPAEHDIAMSGSARLGIALLELVQAAVEHSRATVHAAIQQIEEAVSVVAAK